MSIAPWRIRDGVTAGNLLVCSEQIKTPYLVYANNFALLGDGENWFAVFDDEGFHPDVYNPYAWTSFTKISKSRRALGLKLLHKRRLEYPHSNFNSNFLTVFLSYVYTKVGNIDRCVFKLLQVYTTCSLGFRNYLNEVRSTRTEAIILRDGGSRALPGDNFRPVTHSLFD